VRDGLGDSDGEAMVSMVILNSGSAKTQKNRRNVLHIGKAKYIISRDYKGATDFRIENIPY
jgi:hypothetical protein